MLTTLLALAFAFAPPPLSAPRAPSLVALAQDPSDSGAGVDQAFWADLASTLRTRHGVAATLPEDARSAELRARIETTRLTPPPLDGVEDLEVVTQTLAALTGIPIVLDPQATMAMHDEGITISLNWTHPAGLRPVLDTLTTMAGEEVTWTVDHGAILITTHARASAEQHVFLHPIADLNTLFEADELAALVQENILPGTWENEGVAIEPTGTFLVIVHTREAHLGVERLFTDLRTFQASLLGPPTFAPSPAEVRYDERLASLAKVRITPDFQAGGGRMHIAQVAALLQELSGMNFIVSRSVTDELDEEAVHVDFSLPETDLLSVLNLIPEACPDLRWTLEGGVVRFGTAHEHEGGQILAMYDVRSIVQSAPQDFSFRLRPDDELEAMVLYSSLLEDIIRNTIAPQSWDQDPANSIRISENGVMTVNQTPAVQTRLRAFLKELQAIADTMAEVARRHSR